MNFISKLHDEKNLLLTLEKYDLSDLSTPHTIRTLISSFEEIKNYFKEKSFEEINLDEYVDLLFLEFICLYEEDSEHLLEPFKNQFVDVINFAKSKLKEVDKSLIVKYIKLNYESIFKYDEKYFRSGVRKLSLNIILKFYGGLKDSGLFEFLVRERPIFVFDKYEILSKVLKKNDLYLLRELFFHEGNFEELSLYRFSDICELTEKLYKESYICLADDLGNKIYSYLLSQLGKREDNLYALQNMLHKANKTLYLIKSEHSKKIIDLIRTIDDEVNEFLRHNGQEISYEFTTETYSKMMSELEEKNIDSLTKFMTISHWQDNKTGLWFSRLEREVEKYKPSIIDYVSTSSETNSYFTYGKVMSTDILITASSLSLFYWFKNEDRIKEFKSSFKLVIDSIFEVLNYDTKYEGLEKDVDALITILSDKSPESQNEIYSHMKAMFIISFVEKLLRLVYMCVDEDAFYKKSMITLGTTLGSSQNGGNILEDIIGYHHLKWARYYFLTDGREVGKDYRNRIAHLRDISVGEITFPELIKIAWIIISMINSILVNLINNEEETSSV